MFSGPNNSTPLDEQAIAGLIPDLKTQAELNEFEQSNIASAVTWAFRSRTLKRDLLSMQSLKLLHEKMFNKTWRWSGCLRTSDTNIGVDWHRIPEEVKKLCDDVHFQIERHTYSFEEIATRFHHRLVSIHMFPNGNGRHARLATDLLLLFNNQCAFTWGNSSLISKGQARANYIEALKAADKGDIGPLLVFVKS